MNGLLKQHLYLLGLEYESFTQFSNLFFDSKELLFDFVICFKLLAKQYKNYNRRACQKVLVQYGESISE